MNQLQKLLVAVLVLVWGAGFTASSAQAQTTPPVNCGCGYSFYFLTEVGESCAASASCLAQGTDLKVDSITATSEVNGATKFEVGTFNQGDTFGFSSAYEALTSLGNLSVSADGSIEVESTKSDTTYTVYMFTKQAMDKVYPGTKIVHTDQSTDWQIDLTQTPICLPTAQQNHHYAFKAAAVQDRYIVFTMDCVDDIAARDGAPTSTLGGGFDKARDEIKGLAKEKLSRTNTDLRVAIGRAINVVLGIMGSIALAMFVYAGFLFMVSGTSDSMEKARSILVWSSMGIVVIFASYALLQLIFSTFV